MFGALFASKGRAVAAEKPAPSKKLPVRPVPHAANGAARSPGPPASGPAPRPRSVQQAPAPVAAVVDEDVGEAVPARQVALMRRKPSLAPVGVPTSSPETSPEDLKRFLAYDGKVVSAYSGLTAKQKQFLAAFEDGTLLISRSDANSAPVLSARQLLAREGFKAKATYHVDLEVIRKVHESSNKRSGVISPTRDHDTASMQRTVVELIRLAAGMRCSDIHITVQHFEAKIRVRSDGVMMNLKELPASVALDLCQAAFNMADASDASYKPYEYQGARITAVKSQLPEGVQAVRLQYNPLPDGGRYAILRLLYNQKVGADTDVDQLGYAPHHIAQIRIMREKPFGINIISGPTGSGKSTTLQRALTATLREKRFEVNLITVEDPPEYEIAGAAQLPVLNAKTDGERKEAFRAAIAASLRSDPDIVMIGEIRDAASAGLAFQAAMTGHQVWASLHANDAVSILGRLRDVDVETYKLTDPTLMTGLIGQRLIRRLCDHCKVPWGAAFSEKYMGEREFDVVSKSLEGRSSLVSLVHFARPGGCERCGKRGFAGRTVVAETITPDKKFMDFVAADDKTQAVDYWLDSLEGTSMLEHAILKMLLGECDPRDVKDRVGPLYDAKPERVVRFACDSGIK